MGAFVIIVAIKSPDAADHDDAAHAVIPVIAHVKETQIRASIGAFEPDVVVKHQLRQPGNVLIRFDGDFASSGRAIAQRAEAPFHVDNAPVVG